MRCAKCGFITFDFLKECPKCNSPVPNEVIKLYPLRERPSPPDFTQEYLETLAGASIFTSQEMRPEEGPEEISFGDISPEEASIPDALKGQYQVKEVELSELELKEEVGAPEVTEEEVTEEEVFELREEALKVSDELDLQLAEEDQGELGPKLPQEGLRIEQEEAIGGISLEDLKLEEEEIPEIKVVELGLEKGEQQETPLPYRGREVEQGPKEGPMKMEGPFMLELEDSQEEDVPIGIRLDHLKKEE
jgi:hypothetical protein